MTEWFEDFARYLRERWCEEGEKNEADMEAAIENLRRLFGE